MNCLNIKNIFLLFFLTGLISCQSPEKTAQVTHKESIDKWYGLAGYAHSNLNKHSVFIAASFSLVNKHQSKQVVIKDYQITNKVSQTQVDLLKPSFKNKLVCNPKCYFFNEYFFENETMKNTVMADFFKTYEFKLFDFYSQLFLLNKKLAILERRNVDHVKIYLDALINNKTKYKTLNELSDFLNSALTLDKFIEFTNNPKNIFLANNSFGNGTELWLSDAPEESEIWLSDTVKESENWLDDTAKESENWLSYVPKEKNIWSDKMRKETLINKQNQDFYIGDTVCTPYNSAGIIVEIFGAELSIEEFALAKVQSDGMLSAPADNFLRFKNEAYIYVPYTNEVTLLGSDVFACEVK